MEEKSVKLPLMAGHTLGSGVVHLIIPQPSDLEFIRRLLADPETMAPVGGPVHLSSEDAKDWYRRWVDPGNQDRAYWLVLSENRPVGEIGFRGFDSDSRTGSLNVKIAAWERGQRYGKNALDGLLSFFFGPLHGLKLIDDVALENTGGQALLLNAGFIQNPEIQDVCQLELTKEQYEA